MIRRKTHQKRTRKLPNNNLELELLSQGYNKIVGIDEVGRGCFAGPVYVCGYVYRIDSKVLDGVNDSKLISAKKRLRFYQELTKDDFVVKSLSAKDIDTTGIGMAVTNLIQDIVKGFDDKTFFLIDGLFKENFSKNSKQVTKGDSTHYSISCASIIAKVQRDEYMQTIASKYPEYGFEKNVGYGTAIHRHAIEKYGITPIHRKSFKPMKVYTDNGESDSK